MNKHIGETQDTKKKRHQNCGPVPHWRFKGFKILMNKQNLNEKERRDCEECDSFAEQRAFARMTKTGNVLFESRVVLTLQYV